MCRFLPRCFLGIVFLGLPASCPAQSLPSEDDLDPQGMDVKELAKAAFEASRTTPRRLALARRDAARIVFRELYGVYRAGREWASFDGLVKAIHRLHEAELAVLDDPAQRAAAHERFWRQMCNVEDIVRRRYEVGRVMLADYAQAQYERLNAELLLVKAREKAKKK